MSCLHPPCVAEREDLGKSKMLLRLPETCRFSFTEAKLRLLASACDLALPDGVSSGPPSSLRIMAATKAKSSSGRRGVLAGGNWIIDQVKLIDVYPQREQLANILSQSQGTGGAPYNVLINL